MERITITIDDDLLKHLDSMVNRGNAKSRSHAVDVLLKTAVSQSTIRKAVILAAGKKEKLWSEKHNTIKPLVEVDGKTVIEKILSKLSSDSGVKEFVIVINSNSESIAAKLGDGSALGVSVKYVRDEEVSGSAGALLLCKSLVNEPFLLSYSDVYYPELDVNDLVKFHRENAGAVCTLALVNVKTPNVFGVAKLTGSKIVSFTEKPRSDAQSNLVNAGIAVCDPSIFHYVSKTPCSFEKELLPSLVEKEKLYGYIYSGKWADVELVG